MEQLLGNTVMSISVSLNLTDSERTILRKELEQVRKKCAEQESDKRTWYNAYKHERAKYVKLKERYDKLEEAHMIKYNLLADILNDTKRKLNAETLKNTVLTTENNKLVRYIASQDPLRFQYQK